MKKLTHSLAALALTAAILSFILLHSTARIMLYCIGFAMGGINDWLDFTLFSFLPHRNKVTHGFFSPTGILLGVAGYFAGGIINGISPLFLGSLFVGYYYLHLFLDMRNPTGVYGWGGRKIKGTTYSNDIGANILYGGIALAITALVYLFA